MYYYYCVNCRGIHIEKQKFYWDHILKQSKDGILDNEQGFVEIANATKTIKPRKGIIYNEDQYVKYSKDNTEITLTFRLVYLKKYNLLELRGMDMEGLYCKSIEDAKRKLRYRQGAGWTWTLI